MEASKTLPIPHGVTNADAIALLRAVRQGLPALADLQRQVIALPPHNFPDMPLDADDSEVYDTLSATRLALAAVKRVPPEAVAAFLADVIFQRHSAGGVALDADWWFLGNLEEIAGVSPHEWRV